MFICRLSNGLFLNGKYSKKFFLKNNLAGRRNRDRPVDRDGPQKQWTRMLEGAWELLGRGASDAEKENAVCFPYSAQVCIKANRGGAVWESHR